MTMLKTFLTVVLFFTLYLSAAEPPIAVKHTFQSPFLFGTSSNIPFWEYGGSSVATENFIRLVPAIRSRVGWIWNTEANHMKNWEVVLEFNIHNTHSPGADGMAFWYAKEPRRVGSLFGYAEDFEGIGIIFDTYDNNGNGDNPSIIAVQNNGQHISWDYDHDLQANQLDRCKADIRNPVNGNSKVKIIYNKNVLQVLVDPHNTGTFSFCFAIENVFLKQGYHFGLTAATGGLADYHDVYSFVARDLDVQAEAGPKEQPRKRGWYDPYREDPENFEAVPKQEKKKQQNTPPPPPPPPLQKKAVVEEDEEDHAFFESLRQKLRNFGIEDVDPAPLKEKKKAPEAAPQEQQQQQQQQQQQDVNQPHEEAGISQRTGMLILEALEEVARTVKVSSTKQDINNIIERVNDISNRQSNVQSSLGELRDNIKSEVAIMMDNLKRETKSLGDEIKRLDTMLNTLYVQLDHVSSQQNKFSSEFERSSEDVKQTIKKESSIGFWTFFVLFQIVFAAGIIYWRKYRDVKNMKII